MTRRSKPMPRHAAPVVRRATPAAENRSLRHTLGRLLLLEMRMIMFGRSGFVRAS